MYLSLYWKGSKRVTQGFTLRGSWRLNKDCNILTSTLMAISVVSFSFSSAVQPEARGLSFLLSAGFLYHILSPTGLASKLNRGSKRPLLPGGGFSTTYLVSNSSDLQLNRGSRRPLLPGGGFPPTHLNSNSSDFLSPPSYIIVQSPSQFLERHVWSSSSGNNCHAVQRSLSSGASVYECIMGFYLVTFRQPNPHTRSLLITAIGKCHFLPVHHFGMACLARSKVNIQN